MSVSIATRGIISGFGGAGSGDGAPYPVDIGSAEILGDANFPEVRASYNDEADPSEALPPWNYVEYLPNKRSTEVVLPSKNRTSFPLPGNLE